MKKGIKYFLSCCLILGSYICFGQNTNADSLLTILKTSKSDTTKVNALNNLFLEYEFSDNEKAKEYLNKALELAEKIDYKKGIAHTYINLGYFADDKGDYPEALKKYLYSFKVYEAIGDKKGIAVSYNNIGSVYYRQGNYPEALKKYFASLKLRESIDDKKGIASCFNNIGNVYIHQGNYQEGLKNYLGSLKINKALNDKIAIADSYNNIGIIYYEQSNYSEALKNYFAALEIQKEQGDKYGIAFCYNNIGGVYKSQGNYPEALKNLLASLKIREETGNKAEIASTCSNIGGVLTNQKNLKEAEKYLIKAKELAKEIGYKDYLKDAYNGLTSLDSIKGDFKGAFENNKLYILYCDSLNNEESRKKTIQSQMTFDFEKKEAVANAEHKKELENQQVLAEEKNRKQKIVLLFVSCFLILVLGFAGFIFRSLRLTRKQKTVIEEQKELVEEKQKEILDSIYYARRIQRSLLPTDKYLERNLRRLKK